MKAKTEPQPRRKNPERKIKWPSVKFLKKKAWRLLSHPIFLILTIFGNLLIFCGALVLYFVEGAINPHIHSLLDTVWWAVATVTTVGYGDINPVTTTGKIIGIILMIVGTTLFWSYTALFADAVISDELDDFESELRAIEHKLRLFKNTESNNDQNSQQLLSKIEKHLSELNQQKELTQDQLPHEHLP